MIVSNLAVELSEKIVKMVAANFNITFEQAKEVINSSFEVGEPE